MVALCFKAVNGGRELETPRPRHEEETGLKQVLNFHGREGLGRNIDMTVSFLEFGR